MASAKVQFKLGPIEFSGEGDEAWLATQLDKVIGQTPNLLKIIQAETTLDSGADEAASKKDIGNGSDKKIALGTFLKQKGVGDNQVKRFLATAIWLHERGVKPIATGLVTKALTDNHQAKLSNSADCLNANVTKGFCERNGKNFYITPEGFASMA